MKTKRIRLSSFLCILLSLIFLLGFSGGAFAGENSVSRVRDLTDGILSHQLQSAGADSVQEWLDGELSENAGRSSEWWVLALSRSGVKSDYTAYAKALSDYLAGSPTVAAATKQKIALVLLCIGETDHPYLAGVLDETVGKGGIMSYVFGLHLMNWGVASSLWAADSVIGQLLEMQLADGGWAVAGGYGDVDVTAMTLQALAPYEDRSDVSGAIGAGLQFLSGKQQSDGSFQSYGVKNAESAAQVILTLTALGLDPLTDARFQKGGNDLLDVLECFLLPDGSFCHSIGGGSNATATVQSDLALMSLLRLWEGKSGIYQPDRTFPPQTEENPPVTTPDPPQTGKNPVTSGGNQAVPSTDAPLTGQNPVNSSTTPVQTGQSPVTGSDDSAFSSTTVPQTGQNPTISGENPVPPSMQAPQIGQNLTSSSTGSLSGGDADSAGGGVPIYKVVGTVILILLAAAVGLILRLRGRRHPGNFILLVAVTLVLAVILWAVRIQSPEEYYREESPAPETGPCVYFSIRCDSLLGIADPESIPEDGVILTETRFSLSEGETVYDVLLRAVKSHGIQMENNGTADFAYIAGLGYLYEFDYGDLSGWMYFVNGECPSVGCSSYILSDGDVIEWRYTTNMGEDLKE